MDENVFYHIRGNERPFTGNLDVPQEYRVLTHSHVGFGWHLLVLIVTPSADLVRLLAGWFHPAWKIGQSLGIIIQNMVEQFWTNNTTNPVYIGHILYAKGYYTNINMGIGWYRYIHNAQSWQFWPSTSINTCGCDIACCQHSVHLSLSWCGQSRGCHCDVLKFRCYQKCNTCVVDYIFKVNYGFLSKKTEMAQHRFAGLHEHACRILEIPRGIIRFDCWKRTLLVSTLPAMWAMGWIQAGSPSLVCSSQLKPVAYQEQLQLDKFLTLRRPWSASCSTSSTDIIRYLQIVQWIVQW